MKIYPSLISSDLLNLAATLSLFDDHCDGYHLDVMDDHFVPNLTWGPAFINAIASHTKLPLNVHLMVDNPENWLNRLTLSQKDSFIFHWEALNDVEQVIALAQTIRAKGILAGLAINPKTDVESIAEVFSEFDQILLMSVEPGFSGQKFIDVTAKVSSLVALRSAQKFSYKIGMDGGINHQNIAQLQNAGVDFVGVAHAIFATPRPLEAYGNFID